MISKSNILTHSKTHRKTFYLSLIGVLSFGIHFKAPNISLSQGLVSEKCFCLVVGLRSSKESGKCLNNLWNVYPYDI